MNYYRRPVLTRSYIRERPTYSWALRLDETRRARLDARGRKGLYLAQMLARAALKQKATPPLDRDSLDTWEIAFEPLGWTVPRKGPDNPAGYTLPADVDIDDYIEDLVADARRQAFGGDYSDRHIFRLVTAPPTDDRFCVVSTVASRAMAEYRATFCLE